MANKKAAMEMSVGTLVTIVLLMAVLALGLFLVSDIFTGATDSVDLLNDKVIGEINDMFSGGDSKVIVKLGADHKAKIKRGEEDFGIAVGAQTPDGDTTNRQRLQYKLTLSESEEDSCLEKIGVQKTEELMRQKTGIWIDFDAFEGPGAYARISFNIPEAVTKCSQKILVDVKDNTLDGSDDKKTFAGTFFTIQIV